MNYFCRQVSYLAEAEMTKSRIQLEVSLDPANGNSRQLVGSRKKRTTEWRVVQQEKGNLKVST